MSHQREGDVETCVLQGTRVKVQNQCYIQIQTFKIKKKYLIEAKEI